MTRRYDCPTPQTMSTVMRLTRIRVSQVAALAIGATLTISAASFTRHVDNGLARTPPMGWNSWNKFGCNVSSTLIRGVADAMAANGMRDAGYQYLTIDDCWQVSRDA